MPRYRYESLDLAVGVLRCVLENWHLEGREYLESRLCYDGELRTYRESWAIACVVANLTIILFLSSSS